MSLNTANKGEIKDFQKDLKINQLGNHSTIFIKSLCCTYWLGIFQLFLKVKNKTNFFEIKITNKQQIYN